MWSEAIPKTERLVYTKTIDRAQAAKERAEQRLSNHTAEIDVKRAEFALRKALIRIDVAQHM